MLTAVAGLLLATSCSSSFLDTEPTDAVSSDQVAVAGNAERLFNGAWYNLFEYGTTYANIGYRALQCQDDMMASDVVSRPKYGFNSSYQFNDVAIPSDGRTSFAWYLIYKTIDNCNTAISIKGDSEELRQAQGQALALRAFCYLHLVQHYQFTYLKDKDAPCVPIYTEPTTSGTKPKGKSTVAQVYQQIFDDLNLAQDYLTNYVRKGDGQKFKPNTDVVNGLMARAYLLTGQWGEAAKAAEAARKGYSLMTTTAEYEGFNNISNKEWIWGSPQTLSQSDASYNFYYLDATYVGAYSSFMADPHLMDTFVKGDIRLPLFQWMREGYLGYKKFHMRSDDTADLVLMRSAEMYLIEAEAKVRDGVALDQAVAPLNTLRTARGVGNYDVTGKICPNPYVYNEGKSTWDTFKKAISAKNADHETKKQVPEVWYRVRKTWKNAGSQVGAFKTLKQAKQCADQYAGYRVYNTSGKKVYVSLKLPYKVQVKTGTIPVRSGPAKTYRRVKQISKGVFEITEEKNGFGKLKSGAGWIYLKKVERV